MRVVSRTVSGHRYYEIRHGNRLVAALGRSPDPLDTLARLDREEARDVVRIDRVRTASDAGLLKKREARRERTRAAIYDAMARGVGCPHPEAVQPVASAAEGGEDGPLHPLPAPAALAAPQD